MELAESEILGGVERAPVFIESCAPNLSTPSLGQINSVIDPRTDEIDLLQQFQLIMTLKSSILTIPMILSNLNY